MTTGDHIIKLVDRIETLNDNLTVTECLVELRFHLERWAGEVGDFARELDRIRGEMGELETLTKMQGDELRELRMVSEAQRAWSGR